MASKKTIAESILDFIAKYDRGMDEALDFRDIYVVLDRVTNAYAKKGLLADMKLSDDPNLPSGYVVNFDNQKIYFDPKYELCFSDLPANILNLPYEKGIDFVSSMKNRFNPYLVVSRNEWFLAGRSMAAGADGNVLVWREGARLYYSKRFDGSENIDVFMRLAIAGTGSISEDAEYPIDPSVEQAIVSEVIKYFVGNPMPQDPAKDSKEPMAS